MTEGRETTVPLRWDWDEGRLNNELPLRPSESRVLWDERTSLRSGRSSEIRHKKEGATTHAGDRREPQELKGYRINVWGGMMR